MNVMPFWSKVGQDVHCFVAAILWLLLLTAFFLLCASLSFVPNRVIGTIKVSLLQGAKNKRFLHGNSGPFTARATLLLPLYFKYSISVTVKRGAFLTVVKNPAEKTIKNA